MKTTQFSNRQFVKNKKKPEEQPKEGAWKLAYADFVTAMMCFFMLMWLLNATPSQKLKSMAMYFKPTIGFFTKHDNRNEENHSDDSNQMQQDNNEQETESQSDFLSNIELKINSELSSDGSARDLINNISTKISGDGLEISIFDDNKHAMFRKGTTQLTEDAKLLLAKITKIITYLPNRVIINGHTEKMNGTSIDGYTGWDLSAGRASNAMKIMQVNGLPEEKIAKLVAYGDNSPIDANDPYSSKNRRVTITVLSKWSTVDYKAPISKSALSLD